MKNRQALIGLAAILAVSVPAFAVPALDGGAETLHAQAAFMDGVGAPSGSAAIAANLAGGLTVSGLDFPKNGSGSRNRLAAEAVVPAPSQPPSDIDQRLKENEEFFDRQLALRGDYKPGFWCNLKKAVLSSALPFTLTYAITVATALNVYKDYGLAAAALATPAGFVGGLIMGTCVAAESVGVNLAFAAYDGVRAVGGALSRGFHKLFGSN